MKAWLNKHAATQRSTPPSIESRGVKLLVRPMARFRGTPHQHQTFVIVDPSGNVVEIKGYVRPDNSY